jgi:hypothetical protein
VLADLDLLLTAVFVTADDLLPEPGANAIRGGSDAEVVTLAVAPAMMNIGSVPRVLGEPPPALGLSPSSGTFKDRLASNATAPAPFTVSEPGAPPNS